MPLKRYYQRSKYIGISFALGVVGLLGLFELLSGCSMSKLTRPGQDFARASSCGKCHVQIFQEWSDSPHARAYSNPRFASATDDYRFERCLGCHAPQPEYYPDPPKVRTAHRQGGITCVSCHLEESKLVGPVKPSGLLAPHPLEVSSERYGHSRFCGRCHEGTFAQWQEDQQEGKQTCQQCHMPSVQRKLTQATGLFSKIVVAFEKPTSTKRHSFELIPEELPNPPLSLELSHQNLVVTLVLHNHIPHGLPTGDFGMRIVAIEAEVIDTSGQISQVQKWELTSSGGGALAGSSSREWSFAISARSQTVRVRLIRFGRERTNTAVLLEKEFDLK